MFSSTTLTILFAIAYTVFFLGVLPLRSAVSTDQPFLNQTSSLLTELQNLQQKKDELVKIYNSVPQENIQKLEAMIPASPVSLDIPTLYVFFENVARENSLHLDNITVGSKSGKQVPTSKAKADTAVTALQETQISLSGAGSYASVKSFLGAIETNLRIIELVSLSIVPRDATTYILTASFKAFHQ